MNISVTIFVILISTCIVNASVLDPVIENVVHLQASKPPSGVPGIWKKKTIWKPRWVKEWKSAKVMKPVWKKVWSPVQIKEWVPIPKPPPGWDSASTPLAPVKIPVKTTTKATVPLLWDPVPYPESQQPPPPSYDAHYPPCGNGGCGEPLAFNHEQISGIIGLNGYKNSPDYSQNVEYSETVTHLTRVPPNGNWGQPPQPTGNFQYDNRFNFPELSPFLVPPKFQPLTDNNLHFQFRNHVRQPKPQPSRPSANIQVSHSPGFEVNPSQATKTPPWIPLPPQNIRGHFITKAPDHPYKFERPEAPNRNNTKTTGKEDGEPTPKPGFKTHPGPPVDGDFIQEAQLVGEYHYSEVDLPRGFKPEPPKPEEEKPQPKGKPLQMHQHTTPEPPKPEVKEVKPQKKTPQPPQQITSKGGQKPPEAKRIPQPVVESRPRQIRKDGRQPQQPFRVPLFNSSIQRAEIKEIFPIYTPEEIASSTPLPSNHRFSPLKDLLEKSSPTNFNLFNRTIVEFLQPDAVFHPEFVTPNPRKPPATQKPEPENIINHVTEQTQTVSTTETTTPYTIYPNSSSPFTTEAETEGSVFVVTPAYTIKS